jgi:FKBP-type peptidyl-prolyl cis-trans isomerase (trigger factor)
VKIKVKKVNDYTRELVIDIPWTELESDFNDTIKKFSKKIKMPGFRAGKIPRERLLAQFQPNLEVEFMDTHFQKYYLMAIQQEGLTPVNKAEIKDEDFQMNGNFSFNATLK